MAFLASQTLMKNEEFQLNFSPKPLSPQLQGQGSVLIYLKKFLLAIKVLKNP